MISSKLSSLKQPIVEKMSQLASEFNAIDMAQGSPEFKSPARLLELVNKYMNAGYNQYAPSSGVLPLREAIAEKTQKLYNYQYNPETEITITAGGTQAIYAAISAFVKEEDEVIVFEPAYDFYAPAIKLNGGIPVYIQLKHPDYEIDWNDVTRSINSRTRMIIVNTPHNPTGKVLSAKDLEKLSKLVTGSNILILSDEVYEHLIFDDYEHQSVARYPKLAERSIIISSFGKTFNITGWQLGYCLAPDEYTSEFRAIHQFMMFAVNSPIQYAMAEFLRTTNEYLELADFYEEKRDFFIEMLEDSPFDAEPATGTYFQLLDYSNITDEGDVDFAIRLAKEFGVAPVPVSVFYHQKVDNKLLRFCFAKKPETLKEVASRISQIT